MSKVLWLAFLGDMARMKEDAKYLSQGISCYIRLWMDWNWGPAQKKYKMANGFGIQI